jgi:hypothetical protein
MVIDYSLQGGQIIKTTCLAKGIYLIMLELENGEKAIHSLIKE